MLLVPWGLHLSACNDKMMAWGLLDCPTRGDRRQAPMHVMCVFRIAYEEENIFKRTYLDPINEISFVVLFILTVCHVITCPNWQETNIHFRRILESWSNWYAATLPSVIWCWSIHCFSSSPSARKIWVSPVAEPCRCVMLQLDFHFVGRVERRKFVVEMSGHYFFDTGWILIRNQAYWEFSSNFGRAALEDQRRCYQTSQWWQHNKKK